MRTIVAVLTLTLGVPALLATPKHSYLLREAAEAAKAGDQAAALAKLEDAALLRPDYPRIQLNLARTYAALNRPDDAVAALERIADMGLQMNIAADPVLAVSIRNTPGFQTIATRLADGPAPVAGPDEAAFAITDVTGIIESCLVDPVTLLWYFADVRNRCVWQRDRGTGQLRKFTSDEDAFDGVFKIALSADRKTLWAATATVSAMTGPDAEDGKRSALVAIDFATGHVRARYPVPSDGRKHLLGDFVIAADGALYVTDSFSPVIWRLPAGGGHLESWLESDEFLNLQGIAFRPGEHSLAVADYSNGIWLINTVTKKHSLLTAPASATFFGIDGLYAVPDGLLAVQNGVNPQRVMWIAGAPAKTGITPAKVVMSGRANMTDLALGQVSNGRFHYVADSGWALFDPPPTTPPPARTVVIFSTALE